MHEETRSGDIDVRALQAIVDAARQIVRRCQRFTAIDSFLVVDGDQVGKRSTYIDSDSHFLVQCSRFKVRASRILSFEGSVKKVSKRSFTSFRTGVEP